MNEFADFLPRLLLLVALLVTSRAATPLVRCLGLPGTAAFLAVEASRDRAEPMRTTFA
jgi:hypothetical protein